MSIYLAIRSERCVAFTIKIRLPWWLQGDAEILVNGERQQGPCTPSSLYRIRRTWTEAQVSVVLPKGLTAVPLPDKPDVVAFMDGPVVFAGLCDDERTLRGDKHNPSTLLTPHNEREWSERGPGYRTPHQPHNIRLVPLHEI